MNLLWVRPASGIYTHVRGLLDALSRLDSGDDYVLFTNELNDACFRHLGDRFRRILCTFPARSPLTRIVWEQLWLPRQASRERLTLLHSLSNIAPVSLSCPSVLTLHDVSIFALPETFRAERRALLQLLVKWAARRSAAVITDSDFSRREIISLLGVGPERVFVVHSAVSIAGRNPVTPASELSQRLGITGRYLLALSAARPHKNVHTLLRAFERSRSKAQQCQLIIAGELPNMGVRLQDLAAELGLSREVIFTGPLSDSDLATVLGHATAMVFPSLYEGFGLPVLEAMQAGVPVACSNASSLPEVAGKAALFFDPNNIDQMAEAIDSLLSDRVLRDQLIAAGFENVKRFSWRKAAERTLQVYEWVMTGGLAPQKGTAGARQQAARGDARAARRGSMSAFAGPERL